MALAPAELLAAAVTARDRSYSPYSHFPVGAALLTPGGRVFAGANIENASYGLSMCAERVAMYHALMAGEHVVSAVAVTGPNGSVAMPCGACRQVLHEFGPDMDVIFADASGLQIVPLRTLLPGAFGPSDLARAAVAVAATSAERG
jgi:cytidine deaminase